MTQDKSRLNSKRRTVGQPLPIAAKLAEHEGFKALFDSGMRLIEETANYLDAEGRVESQNLERVGAVAYASESMRLTTRLMQLASWLLVQRAINEGEMEAVQGREEKAKIRLGEMQPVKQGAGWEALPFGLRELIDRTERLEERVRHLDIGLGGSSFTTESESDSEASSPVADHMARLQAAFSSQNTN